MRRYRKLLNPKKLAFNFMQLFILFAFFWTVFIQFYSPGSNHIDHRDIFNEAEKSTTEEHLYSGNFDWKAITSFLALSQIASITVLSQDDPSVLDHYQDLTNVDYGTTYKWLIVFENGQLAIFKPKWYGRDYLPENWFEGFELHTSEVAAFHLDNLLGFRRVPFTSGRRLDMRKEVLPVASKYLLDSIQQKGDELCIKATCYFCVRPLTTCTQNGLIEGAVIHYVHGLSEAMPDVFAIGQRHKPKCEHNTPMANGHFPSMPVLQRAELSILDFISHHYDSKVYRHHLGGLVYADRGRSFTHFDTDDETILEPFKLCCMKIPLRTEERLLELYQKHRLIDDMKAALLSDPLGDDVILSDGHLVALQRRLFTVLRLLKSCRMRQELS